MDVDTRYKSTSRIVEVNGNQSEGGNLHTLNNPSAIGGRGGSCFGDSGGPVFVNNTNQVVAVVSYGSAAPATAPTTRGGSTPGQLRVHRSVPGRLTRADHIAGRRILIGSGVSFG